MKRYGMKFDLSVITTIEFGPQSAANIYVMVFYYLNVLSFHTIGKHPHGKFEQKHPSLSVETKCFLF